VKFLRYLCVGLVLIAFAVAAGTVLPRGHADDIAANSRPILVLKNPIHTDIALPVDAELLARFGFLRNDGLDIDQPGLRYLIIGWGRAVVLHGNANLGGFEAYAGVEKFHT